MTIKVRITHRRGNGAKAAASRKHYDVFKFMKCAQEDGNQTTRASFVEVVESKVKSNVIPVMKSGQLLELHSQIRKNNTWDMHEAQP